MAYRRKSTSRRSSSTYGPKRSTNYRSNNRRRTARRNVRRTGTGRAGTQTLKIVVQHEPAPGIAPGENVAKQLPRRNHF